MIQRNPAHRGDPLFLPDVLRAFGVKVAEFQAWKDRGQGDFRQIWGVVAHHTGSNNASPASIAYGHAGLQGLLSQMHLDRNGLVTVVGAGIAWHAGVGEWPGIQKNNANPVTVGIEAASDGTSPWPEVMLDAYYRTCAAICWYLGHSSLRTIGHKEWAKVQGKWDPGGIDMNVMRAKIQFYIDNPPFMPKPEQLMEGGETMAFWDDQVPSMVDPAKKFARKDFFQLIDYHAALANIQSKQILEQNKQIVEQNKQVLAEMKLVQEDVSSLAQAIVASTRKG